MNDRYGDESSEQDFLLPFLKANAHVYNSFRVTATHHTFCAINKARAHH
jgi:hypothetical protein